MDTTFKLSIRTPETELLSQEVHSVRFAAEGGEMQVFAGHASITASILFSPVVVKTVPGDEMTFLMRRGMFLFDNDRNEAAFLALYAEEQSEVNRQSVEEYVAFVEEQLRSGKDLSQLQVKYLEGEKLAVEQQMQAMDA